MCKLKKIVSQFPGESVFHQIYTFIEDYIYLPHSTGQTSPIGISHTMDFKKLLDELKRETLEKHEKKRLDKKTKQNLIGKCAEIETLLRTMLKTVCELRIRIGGSPVEGG